MKKSYFLKALSRRKFIKNTVVATTGASLIPAVISGCNDDDDTPAFVPEGNYGFFEGVASFDPTQTQVILWTRYTPASNEESLPQIILDVATDESFNQLVASQTVEVDTINDNTVNVDVSNLTSNTKYFYRFRNETSNAVSITGETKTLPASGEAAEVKMAVVSCANYQAGLFNVYGGIADSDAEVVIHLGDYIYEYAAGGYGSNDTTTTLGREHEPSGEIIELEDYRTRYKQYRSDEQLQKLHQLKPFICVWDDHEIANDAYKDGAENQQSDEGDFETRKMNALQVWHEYLPARVNDTTKIYRSFDFAGIVNLMMLDTRIIGRDKQLDYTEYFTASGLDAVAFAQDWQSNTRTILGSEQRDWLTGSIAASSAKWQVLGSQVLMGKYMIPSEMLLLVSQITSTGITDELIAQYTQVVTELVTIKVSISLGLEVSDEDRARVENVLPYNLDAWDGYPVEREIIFAAASGKKLISLAGDTHNAWYSKLSDSEGNVVGEELATPSVSSPGFEAIFGDDAETIAALEQANTALIDDLQYTDASRRGYLYVKYTESDVEADWRFISTLASLDTATESGKNVTVV